MNKTLASLKVVRGMLLRQATPPVGIFVGGFDATPTMIGSRSPSGFTASLDDFVNDNWPGEAAVEFQVEVRHLPAGEELLILWRV